MKNDLHLGHANGNATNLHENRITKKLVKPQK